MNNVFTIIKKELKRFFTDKRMLLSLFLPGILIFLLYSVMGSFIGDAFSASEDHTYTVYLEDVPEEYKAILDNSEYTISYVDSIDSIENIKESIEEKELDLYLQFDKDFNDKITNNQTPNVTILYNSSSPESLELYTYTYTSLLALATNVSYDFLVNMTPDTNYDLATNEDISAMIITMLLPFLLLTFLFTGCVSISTESIAGEKERGTIATLLVTPTKRSHIAIGKIIALSITSLVSACSSFIGVILSIPKLMGNTGAVDGADITLSMYGIETYLGILGIIIVTVIFFTTLISIVSAFAKNLKEASQWTSILMVFVMMFGVTSMMSMGKIPTNPFIYLIPVYNSVQCMSAIFSLEFNALTFAITLISNICYIALGIFALTKMFNSEKIMSSN